ncbi:hypothetical protein PHMEG_0004300 [Phytophthora megakarya]|uniref:Uncharacterized protein n=1 Tax=Phytophthora megakarya TaxID=4795 RepID=A0A225WU93_9STRA|nr:hypothetical protein PHMEG_0004300 [Phytophthora megakarya]
MTNPARITRSGKKPPIFWASDGVNWGKSSLRVVLEWMTNPANFDKWPGSDHTSGKTKETLLTEIVGRLVLSIETVLESERRSTP